MASKQIILHENAFLIDTQIFIWWMEKNKKLSKDLFNLINLPKNQIFLSIASIWEIIIKRTKKKLKLSQDIEEGIKVNNISILPVELTHVLGVEKLPLLHNDPFDRVIISQAKVENLSLITSDEKIWKYEVRVYKA